MNRIGAKSGGFSLIEVLVVVAVVLTLGFFLLTSQGRARARFYRISCSNQLRSMGLAFKTWGVDNEIRYPWHVPTIEGGAMEAANAGNLAFVFQVMSNEVSTPKVLICPADRQRVPATNFVTLRNTNISYFVGLDATNATRSAFLLGDCNISNAGGVRDGVLLASTNESVSWTAALHQNCGNIGLEDGSVRYLSTAQLREAIAKTGIQTNRLLMP
jgi:prepilin-type N-terminal cleavage/methylation domain-containing protein